MKAVRWYGKHDIRVEKVDDPQIIDPTDAIIKITATAICRSGLPSLQRHGPHDGKGDILGHEPMSVVDENESQVRPDRPVLCHHRSHQPRRSA